MSAAEDKEDGAVPLGKRDAGAIVTRSLFRCRTLLVVAAVLGAGGNAEASPSSKLVFIRGAGAEACPGDADLRKSVAARLGYDPFFPSAQKTVVAEVSRTAGGYRGKVQIVGDSGTLRGARELATKGDDCSELVSTMALAISIAIDDLDAEERANAPEEPARPAERSEMPPVPEPPPNSEPAPLAPASPKEKPRAARPDIAASLGPTASFGTAPAPAVGASVVGTLGYGLIALRASARGDLSASAPFAPGGRVSAQTFIGSLEACVRGGVPFLCAGGALGSIATETTEISQGATDHGLLASVVGTVGARVPLGSALYLEPFASGAVHLVGQDVEVDRRSVFSLPRIGGTLGLHLGWQIY